MKFIGFVIFGLGIFHVALSDGLFDFFGITSNESESSEYDFGSLLLEFFGIDFDNYDDSDEDSEEDGEPVSLPSGPSWLQTMNLTRPQPPTYHPPQPGHQQEHQQPQPLPVSNYEPPSTPESFYPPSQPQQEEEQQQQQQEQQQQQQQQVQSSFNNSQPIPILPPLAEVPAIVPSGDSNDTTTTENSLILSIPGDEGDDTDGEGVLVGEEKTL